MMKRRALTVLTIAILGACSSEEARVDEALQEEAVGSGTEVVPVGLSSLGDSGVTGQATLVGEGEATRINVTVVGLNPEARLSGRVYEATCAAAEAGADAVAEIGPVALDPYGTLTTTVAIPLAELQRGTHSVVLIEAVSSAPIACAEVVTAGS